VKTLGKIHLADQDEVPARETLEIPSEFPGGSGFVNLLAATGGGFRRRLATLLF
jgi:hypothetical protein